MNTADKVWIAVSIGAVVLFRDRRQARRIKKLMQLNTLLGAENQILTLVLEGKLDQKALLWTSVGKAA